MSNTIRIKSDGIVQESTDTELIREVISNSEGTKCWDCSNGFPSKCSKIAALRKESIESYDFIKKGFQVVRENGDIPVFAVLDCANYHMVKPKPLMSSTERRKLMDGILLEFYGTNDLDAAKRTVNKNFKRYRQ